MSDEHDFAIDDGVLQAAADLPADSSHLPDAGSVPAPAPRVLIEYRSRGIHAALWPPLMILVVAIGITSYQRQARLRPAPPPAPRAKPTAPANAASPASPRGRIIMVEAAATGATIQPITIRSATPPPPPPTASDSTATAQSLDSTPVTAPSAPGAAAGPEAQDALAHAGSPAETGPFSPFSPEARKEDARAAAPPLEPPAPLTSASGSPLSPDTPELTFAPIDVVAALTRDTPRAVATEPKVTKEQIQQEIDAEAQQKKAEQANLGREVEASKAREFFDTIKKAADDRVPFHDELHRILLQLGNDAGPEIKNLCDRYGQKTHPDIEKVVTHTLNRSGAGFDRDVKIKTLRKQGLPEPMILDILARDLDKQIRGKRGGPRDRNGVRVRAALLLLNYPPPPMPEENSAAAPGTHTSTAVRTPATP